MPFAPGERSIAAMRTLITTLLAVAALAAPASADPLPSGADWHEEYIATPEGRLHADVYRPAGLAPAKKTPVLMLISPYLGNDNSSAGTGWAPAASKPSIRPWYRPVFEWGVANGYTVTAVALPGYGASGGCSDFMGPREQRAAAAAVRWGAGQAWSNGRVGTFGGSYDGWTQVAALAQRVPGHRAAMVMAPVVDLHRAAFTNGIAHWLGGTNAVLYGGYAEAALLPASAESTPAEHAETAAGTPAQAACSADYISRMNDANPGAAVWRERRLSDRLRGVRVPTLLQAGFHDYNVGLAQFGLIWPALRGPKRLWALQIDHQPPDGWLTIAGRGGQTFYDQVFRWFERHVKGRRSSVRDARVEVQEGHAGALRTEKAWPPRDARPAAMEVLPGSYTDVPGNKGEQGDGPAGSCQPKDPRYARCVPGPTGVGSWTFTRPLAGDEHLVGTPRLRIDAQAGAPAQLVALLYDVDPDGEALLITRGATLLPANEIDLFPQDWHLEAGHRLGLLITASDGEMFTTRGSGQPVQVRGGSLSVDLVERGREGTLPVEHPNTALAARGAIEVDPTGREVALSR